MAHDSELPRDSALSEDDPGAELRSLGRASDRALQVIRQAIASGEQGAVSPVEAVGFLDDAMKQLHGLLAAVPELLTAADLGPAVEADMKARADELSAMAEQMNAISRDLASLKARKLETQTRLAELTGLREQVDELRRRERLAAILQKLNEQRQVIDERLVLLRQLTGPPEDAIAAGSDEVLRLAGERLALLAPHVRDTLAQADEALRSLAEEEKRADAARQRLTEVRQDLTAAQQRQEELVAERDGRVAQLAAHARAESALVKALSSNGAGAAQDPAAQDPVGRLQTVLEGITTQLDEVDGTLRDALVSNQDDYDREHGRLAWTDR